MTTQASGNSVKEDIVACATCSQSAAEGTTLKRCAGCRTTYYCSKVCQRVDWANHKESCKSNTSKGTPINTRLPVAVQIGPVTTVGEVLNARHSGPPTQYQETLYQPTAKEIYERCTEIMRDNSGDNKNKEK